jgi:hypothetical protein
MLTSNLIIYCLKISKIMLYQFIVVLQQLFYASFHMTMLKLQLQTSFSNTE